MNAMQLAFLVTCFYFFLVLIGKGAHFLSEKALGPVFPGKSEDSLKYWILKFFFFFVMVWCCAALAWPWINQWFKLSSQDIKVVMPVPALKISPALKIPESHLYERKAGEGYSYVLSFRFLIIRGSQERMVLRGGKFVMRPYAQGQALEEIALPVNDQFTITDFETRGSYDSPEPITSRVPFDSVDLVWQMNQEGGVILLSPTYSLRPEPPK